MAADFSRFLQTDIVNSHVHFSEIGAIDATRAFLQGIGMNAVGLMSVLLPGIGRPANGNAAVMAFKAKHPGTTYIHGAIDWRSLPEDDAAVRDELQRQADALALAGFDGVKILETKPNFARDLRFPLDAPEFDGFWERIERERMPVTWHVADPEQMWENHEGDAEAKGRGWDYADGTYPLKDELHAQAERVLAKFPRLTVIFAHFCFFSNDLRRAGALLDAYPNVYLDITPGTEMFTGFTAQHKAAAEFFTRYRKRIIFGDDTSVWGGGIDEQGVAEKVMFIRRFLETEDQFEMPDGDENFFRRPGTFKGLGLPEEVLRLIYAGNYRRIAGSEPRPLNRTIALGECERLLSGAQRAGVPEEEECILQAIDIIVST